MQQTQTNPVTPEEFAQKIKAKYPQYADVEDSVLVEKILEKYPQYREQISFDTPQKKSPDQTQESEPITPDQELVSPTEDTSSATTASDKLNGVISNNDHTEYTRVEEPVAQDTESPQPVQGEPEGFWSNKWREIRTGSTMLGETAASYIEGVYDLFALPQNAIAAMTGNESLSASSEKFKKTFDVENPLLDYYAAETKKLKEETNDFYSKKYGTDEYGNPNSSPADHISKGNYFAAFETLGGMVAESAPTSMAMMVGGAAGGGAGTLAAYATPAFVSGSREDLKQTNPEAYEEMTELERSVKSFSMAGAETVFSAIGTGTIGKVYGDIIKKEGAEQGAVIFKEGLIKMYETALKKYGVPIAMTGEGIEEVATAITQNMIKGVDPFQGVPDAFLAGVGGGAVHGAPINAIKAAEHINEKITERSVKKSIDNSGTYQKPSDLFTEDNASNIDDVQVTIAGKKHSRSVIEKDLKKQVKEGVMTEEEATRNLQLFDETKALVDATKEAGLSEGQQVKAVNLLREKIRLEEKIKGKDKDLFKPEKERIKALGEQIANLRNTPPAKNPTAEEALNAEDVKIEDGFANSVHDRIKSDLKSHEEGMQDTEDKSYAKYSRKKKELLEKDPIKYYQEKIKLIKEEAKEDGDESGYHASVINETQQIIDHLKQINGIRNETKQEPSGETGTESTTPSGEGASQTGPDQSNPGDVRESGGQEGNTQGQEVGLSTEVAPEIDESQQEEYNVLTMLKGSKILSPEEKAITYRQYKRGAMKESDVQKLTSVNVEDVQSGEVDKWGRVVLDKLKGKEIEAEDVEFEEVTTVQQSDTFMDTEQRENVNTPKLTKEKTKEIADKLRSLKINKTVGDATNKLQSNPVGGLFSVAWDGAIEVAATTIEVTGNVAQAMQDAYKAFEESDYFKGLKERDKAPTRNEFRKKVNEVFEPYKQAQVKPKKVAPKTQTRKTTGQTDTSPKVTTTARKLTRDLYKAEAAGARAAYTQARKDAKSKSKSFKEAIKGFLKGTQLSPAKTEAFVKKASGLATMTEKELDKFFDQIGRAVVHANRKMSEKKLAKHKRAAKKKIKKLGKDRPSAYILTNIDTDRVPADMLDEYMEVIEMIATLGNFNPKRVDKLVEDGLGEIYQEQSNEEFLDRITEEKKDEDKTKQIEELNEAMDETTINPEDFKDNKEVYDIIKTFNSIPREWLHENMSKVGLSALTKAVRAAGNGGMLNKSMNTAVMKYEAVKLAEDMEAKVGNKFIRPIGNLIQEFTNIFKRNKAFKTDSYRSAINSVMVHHIDTVVSKIKGLSIYKDLLHPITSQLNKAHEETNKVEQIFTKKIKAARSTRKGQTDFQFNALLRHYLAQKEYENEQNRDQAGKKLFSARQHMEATESKRNRTEYSDASVEDIRKMFDMFTDKNGEFDTKKAEAYFNAKEKDLIQFMRDNLEVTKARSMEVNDQLRGETLPYNADYFPRKTYGRSDSFIDGLDMSQRLTALLGSTSTKAGASNTRKDKKAKPLDYDTFGTFMNHYKENALEYNVSFDLKKTGIVLSRLQESSNESLQMLAKAIESGTKILIKSEMGQSSFTPKTKTQQIFNFMVRRTFTSLLIDPVRYVYDSFSTYSTFTAAYADRIANGSLMKAANKYDHDFRNELFSFFGSTHMSRLAGNRSVDIKESEMSSLNNKSFKQADPSLMDSFIDLMKKNKVADWGDRMGQSYYSGKLGVDAPAKWVWAYEFDKTFKKITGKEFDKGAFSDSDYRYENTKAIKQAITEADKQASILFNTATRAEQKLSVQAARQDSKIAAAINTFMRSFPFNENRAWWDSAKSVAGGLGIGKGGTMDFESAVRAQIIINSRALLYTFLQQMAMQAILKALVPDMEDDEEVLEKAAVRSIAQHGVLLTAGNRGLLANIATAMVINQAHEHIHNSNDPDKKFNIYDDGIVYGPPERGDMGMFLGMGGAQGYTLSNMWDIWKSGNDIIGKALDEDHELTKEDWVDAKVMQVGVSTISQMLNLPIARFGIVGQKYMETAQEYE